MAREQEGLNTRNRDIRATRRRADMWDRLKILVLLAVIIAAIIASSQDLGFLSLWDVTVEFFSTTAGMALGALFLLELIRQIHYWFSERSAAYNSFWQDSVFGGIERWTQSHFKPWTRLRVARFIRRLIYLFVFALVLDYFIDEVNSPIEALVEAPRILVDALPFIFQLMFGFLFVAVQVLGIFWLLSRGGTDVILPEEVTTRFDDVWGQDHVLDLIKENIAFLEKPDEIEAKGGYIPGGILLWGPPGTGKGEPVKSLVMTPSGPRRMGDFLPGDLVIGSDGRSTRIDEVHLLGERDIYRVHFSDGASLRVTEDHLWQVMSRYGGTEVIETGDLLGRLTEADGHHRYRIPMVEPVEFEHRPVPLDPYLLGILLGDGSFRSQLKVSLADDEIIEAVRGLLPAGDVLQHHTANDFDVIGGSTRTAAKELGLFDKLSHEKFVPEDYLWTSYDTRLALLQGLMDSDGTVDQRGGIVFSSTSRALADAVILLVQSFGGVATKRERVPTNTYLGESREGRLSYEVRISIGNEIPVFRLTRKRDRVAPRTKHSPIRLMTDITRDGREEARCIKVSAADQLYVSENFVVTHNTLMAQAVAGETGRPYVFVEPGAFINMFFGIGLLKVKGLYRKLRKLSLRHGGVIVFFDEADSLGSRGSMGTPQGQLGAEGAALGGFTCNGFSYLAPQTQEMLVAHWSRDPETPAEPVKKGFVDRIMMGGMGMGGGGMGVLQALLTEMNGLTKPRGMTNRIRKILGFRPKPPPRYRILHIMATNMPNALDEAMLRPGRIDRIYKVAFPSKEGRRQTIVGYLNKVEHHLSEAEIDRLATVTPYYSGAKIKDMVNEALIIAVRDGREAIEWPDIWKAKSLKELGPPEDVDYIQRERHAVAIHEASHAVTAHLLGAHRRIDMVSIEKRASTLGMVKSMGEEERFTQWRSEMETDIMVSLASLAGERLFFAGDNSSGVSGDLSSASTVAALMEGSYGMGKGLSSAINTRETGMGGPASPVSIALRERREQIEASLADLYDRVGELLEEHQDKILELAAVLEEKKTISGEEVAEIMGSSPGSRTMREPKGWQAVSDEVAGKRQRDALERSGREAVATHAQALDPDDLA